MAILILGFVVSDGSESRRWPKSLLEVFSFQEPVKLGAAAAKAAAA
ncbi:MAG: hypothetical protein QM757_34135 [Paludibaculum sp.]